MLQGKLSYTLATIAVLFGVMSLVSGLFVTNSQALEIIWAGLSVFGLRRAIGGK